jgi:hypothetical protein
VYCVALVDPTTAEADALRRQLESRGWKVALEPDPVAAMTEVCLRDRTSRTDAAWKPEEHESVVLVVADPPSWPHWPELRDAVRRHLPDVTLHTFMAGELIETSAAPPPRDDSEAAGDARPTKDAEDRNDGDDDTDPNQLLTRAEIEMLLEPPRELDA